MAASNSSRMEPMQFQDNFKKIRSVIFTAAERPDVTVERHTNFRDTLSEVKSLLDDLEECQQFLSKRCHGYDFIDSNGVRTEGNGYRSLLSLLDRFLYHFIDWFQDSLRPSVFGSVENQLESLNTAKRAINGLKIVFRSAVEMMKDNTNTLVETDFRPLLTTSLTEDLARDFFYGKFLGFQYSNGVKTFLTCLMMSFACYDHWYTSNERFLTKIFTRLLKTAALDDTERGIMIANVSDGATLQLTKEFWSIPEKKEIQAFLRIVNKLLIPAEVFADIIVPPDSIDIQTLNGTSICMNPPVTDDGERTSIRLLLISNTWRKGQPPPSNSRSLIANEPSDILLIHIHGGGFVATSPNSHEAYLRYWSRELDCPVVSIDYSLSPESPYPRALEECVFVYCWILKNCEQLGTTTKRIYLVGDSAGGNLIVTTSMRLKLINVRLPDHIIPFYPSVIMKLSATPSRFLALFDLILPLGILLACLQAYTGGELDEEIVRKRRYIREQIYRAKGHVCPPVFRLQASPQIGCHRVNSSLLAEPGCVSSASIEELTGDLLDTYRDLPITNNPLVSPALASEDMLMGLPPVTLICGSLDPLLDDGVTFARRLKAIGQPVQLKIFSGLSHGFLNIFHWTDDIQEAKLQCISILKKIML